MIPYWEIEELARFICGLSEDDDETDVEEVLYEKFGVEMDAFEKVINALMPMVTVAQSPITLMTYRGFADTARNLFIVKQPML